MKITRLKKSHKILSYYMTNFEYREPYQIIIDATFCQAALQNKVAIDEQLKKYLQAEVKLLTTQCIILEAESLGRTLSGATSIVKKYRVHKCGHEGKPITGSACIKDITKTSRYIVATQDRSLQNALRRTPGRALLYLHKATPVLEPPSDASKKHISNKNNALPTNVGETIEKLKKDHGLGKEEDKPLIKKKRPKNPNPLSCKKRKPKAPVPIEQKKCDPSVSIKRKRKKVKIPSHVKEILQKNK